MERIETYVQWNENGIKREYMPQSEQVFQAMLEGVFPYLISHEYLRLYQMLEDRQITGAWYQMKDVIEVIIKFPVLAGLSYIVGKAEECFEKDCKYIDKNRQLIQNLLDKELALGDWIKLVRKLSIHPVVKEELPTVQNILDKVKWLDHTYEVVKWRNQNIGHGALPFETDDTFIEEFVRITYGVNECLEQSCMLYNQIQLFCGKIQVKYWTDIENDNTDIIVKMSDDKEIQLKNFIINREYFFDGFNKNVFLSYCLSYMNGNRYREFISMYKNLYQEIKPGYKNQNLSSTVVTAGADKTLRMLNMADRYEHLDILDKWLHKKLGIGKDCEKRDRGVFLLFMDRGMGKTAFAASLDQLINEEAEYEDFCARVYYCNALEYRGVEDFTESMNILFSLHRNSEKMIIKNQFMRLSLDGDGKELGEVLGDTLEKLQESDDPRPKLLLVIDGLDEIQNTKGRNIFQFIPSEKELPKDVYILLTCRNEDTEQLKDYTKREINKLVRYKIRRDDILNISLKDKECKESYKKHLDKYLTWKLLNRRKKPQQIEKEVRKKMEEYSACRFLDYKLLAELAAECMNNGYDYHRMFKNEYVVEDYLNYIEALFGEKLYRMAGRILIIIATSYVPLDLESICFLNELQPGLISMSLLAVIQTFDSLLLKIRTGYGTGIKIANEEYRNYIIHRLQSFLPELALEWLDYITRVYQLFVQGEIKYSGNEMYNNRGEVYLYGHIYDFVKQTGSRELLERMKDEEVIKAILYFENYLPADQLGNQARYWDLNMTGACIELFQKRKAQGLSYDKRSFAIAYNNFAFHYGQMYKNFINSSDQSDAEYKERKKIVRFYDSAIEEVEGIYRPADEGEGLENMFTERDAIMLSKFYSGKGVFLNRFKENMGEIEQLFLKSYEICRHQLDKKPVEHVNNYILAVIRVLNVYYSTCEFRKAERLYLEAAERIQAIKQQIMSREDRDNYLTYNPNLRIEYGILCQEAMLDRQMAAVYFNMEKQEHGGGAGGQAERLYKKAAVQLKSLVESREKESEKDRINQMRWEVLQEYSRFLVWNGRTDEAWVPVNEAAELVDVLLERDKLDENEMTEELFTSWYGMSLNRALTEKERERQQIYRERAVNQNI